MSDDKEAAREGYARRKATESVAIQSEPRTYGPAHPDHSYFQDLALAAVPGTAGAAEATQRLARHDAEVHADAEGPGGEYARAGLREYDRPRSENRAMSSGGSSGGPFVSPEWLTSQYAVFRSAEKAFTNQTMNLPIPDYGLQVNVPSFTSTASVAQQTENAAVSETDPSGADIQVSLVTIAGQVTISQQLQDRGGMSGLAFDKIISAQLGSQLGAAEDVYVINQSLANAGTVTDATAFTMALFYQDIAKARELLTDTAGTRLAATHVFSTSDLFSYVTRQLDSSQRPIVVPDSAALVASDGDPNWFSFTGVHLPAALRWFADDNIPASGGNTQILVARPQELLTFDGDPIAYAYPETLANQLSVVVGLRAYIAVVARYPKAVAAISGATYPTTLV